MAREHSKRSGVRRPHVERRPTTALGGDRRAPAKLVVEFSLVAQCQQSAQTDVAVAVEVIGREADLAISIDEFAGAALSVPLEREIRERLGELREVDPVLSASPPTSPRRSRPRSRSPARALPRALRTR